MTTTSPKPAVKRQAAQAIVVAYISTPEETLELFYTAESGKVITRQKIDTITNVFHPGIILGNDKYGRTWIAHNHYHNKKPTINLIGDFLLGGQAQTDSRSVLFERKDVVQRAIEEVLKGKTYNFLNYNCQTFVSLIVNEENSSEAVDKITDAAMFFGGATLLLGLLTKNKALMITGASIAGVGGGAKALSRYQKSPL